MDVTFLKMDIWMEIWNAFLKGKMETKHVPNLIVFYLFALHHNATLLFKHIFCYITYSAT